MLSKLWKKVICGHRFCLVFFVFLVAYHVIIVNRLQPWRLEDLSYSFLCVDYSFGFASKLLPGAIFNWVFGENASRENGSLFNILLIILFFIGVSYLLEAFLKRVPEKSRATCFLLLLFFVSGGYTFSIFTKTLGLLDSYWLYSSILFLCFLNNKYLRFLIPVVYIASLMIHFSAVVFVLPLYSVVILYRIATESNKKEQKIYISIFGLSLGLAIIFLLFLLFSESNMVVNIDEFHEKMRNHGSDFYTYYDYSFFHLDPFGNKFIPDSFNEIKPAILRAIYLVFYQSKIAYSMFKTTGFLGIYVTLGSILVLFPPVWFALRFLWLILKKADAFFKKISLVLMMLEFPMIFVIGILFAVPVDMVRYCTHGFLAIFTTVLVLLFYDEEARLLFFEQLGSLKGSLPLHLYVLTYAVFNLAATL